MGHEVDGEVFPRLCRTGTTEKHTFIGVRHNPQGVKPFWFVTVFPKDGGYLTFEIRGHYCHQKEVLCAPLGESYRNTMMDTVISWENQVAYESLFVA
ncbi:hypothetical protein [Granulicella sibirica]|uniref:Uncharacterized protein n=1 Tax=Granulicella sibirica TaxID=2479048 RepID=A0A4Q0T632_9BACT|nr:hypothetical protein [Granulicella sibirica]RXH57076.1 hypothetical protein GRAN_0386 [Granulicella sibirica]